MAAIVVTGRDARISTREKQHAEGKLEKLERYFDGIHQIEAVLGHEADAADVEFIISVRKGKPIVCHSQAKELYAAIDLCLDKAESQLTKFKERAKKHRAEAMAAASAETASGSEDDNLESYEDIVDKTDFSQ
mgnify:CR=1 FL=1